MAKMDNTTLQGIISAKLNNTLGWIGGSLQNERQKALQYYRGDLFGNEQDGRSKVVSRDVAESIDQAMPSLMKIFASTDTYVVFSPRRPEAEEGAKQKTDYTNWVFQVQPNSFNLLQTSLKDGLLSKTGVSKSWWDESITKEPEEYEGLTKAQYLMLLSDENVEEVSCETRSAPQSQPMPTAPPVQAPPANMPPPTGGPGQLPQTPANFPGMQPPAPPAQGQPQGNAGGPPTQAVQQPPSAPADPLDDGLIYNCKIMRTNKTGKVCIEIIPPEEFLTERRSVSTDSLTFAAHRSSRTRSELIEMGYSKAKINGLPGSTDSLELNPEKINRFLREDDQSYVNSTALDKSMEKIWVAECYLKVDYDGDGVAEWRKAMMAGDGADVLLDDEPEECEGHPFTSWSPYLQPHKLIGESMADKVIDLQLWKSTVVREMNDGMYFNNAPQLIVVEGQANMEDVLTRRPGGVIRAKSQGAVMPLEVVDTSASCMQAISYIDSVRETRTGVRRFSAGLNGDELNPYASTATGINKVDDSSQDALDLIARNYAEQFLKPLFKRIAELTTKYQDKATTVKLRGKWVNIDPSSWDTEMDATVTVGLGSGNKDKTVQSLMAMLTQVDAPIVTLQGGLSGPVLTAPNVYNKLTKLTEAMGYKDADAFYTDPSTVPPQPPKPDPNMAKVQGQLQLAQQKNQADLQAKQQQGQLDAQLEQEKAQRQSQHEAAQAQADMATQHQKAQLEAQLEQQKAAHQAQLDTIKAQHEIATQRMRAMADIEISRAKAQVDAHVKIATAKAIAAARPKKPKAQPTA